MREYERMRIVYMLEVKSHCLINNSWPQCVAATNAFGPHPSMVGERERAVID